MQPRSNKEVGKIVIKAISLIVWVLLVVQPVNLQFLYPEVEHEQGFGRTCQSSFSLCSAWAGWSLADKMCPASTDCTRQGRSHPWALQWEKPDFQTVGQL